MEEKFSKPKSELEKVLTETSSDKGFKEISPLAKVLKECVHFTCPNCGKSDITFPEQFYGKYYVCRYCGKEIKETEIPLFIELLHKASLDIKNSSYRDALVNSYSALEVFLSKNVLRVLKLQEVPEEVINYIFDKKPSVKDYLELLNNYISNKLNYDKVIKATTELRNKIVHKGYKPKPTETKDSFKQVIDLMLNLQEQKKVSPIFKLYAKRKAIKNLLKKRNIRDKK